MARRQRGYAQAGTPGVVHKPLPAWAGFVVAILQPRAMTTPYVATGPEDLIALVPTVLRFQPEESVVVMTFGARGRAFHARVELPRRPRDQDEVAGTILKAMRTNHLRDCAIVLYSQDRPVAAAQGRKLNRKLRRAGIRVVDVLVVDGDRYFRVLRDDQSGTIFDIGSHPFTAQRVLDGVVVHKSRSDLAATLDSCPEGEGEGNAVTGAAQRWLNDHHDAAAEAQWVRTVLAAALPHGSVAGEDLPRLLADLVDPGLTDVAWAAIDRPQAEDYVQVWRDLVRRSPQAYVDAPACLLAFSAWLAGDGALAWCALDRCGPTSLPIVGMLEQLMHSAVSPKLWPGLSAEELGALRGPAA